MLTKAEIKLLDNSELAKELRDYEVWLDELSDTEDPYDDTGDIMCSIIGWILEECSERGIDPYDGKPVAA